MKNLWNKIELAFARIDRQKLQVILLVALLVMMVLAAGAPDDGGTIITKH